MCYRQKADAPNDMASISIQLKITTRTLFSYLAKINDMTSPTCFDMIMRSKPFIFTNSQGTILSFEDLDNADFFDPKKDKLHYNLAMFQIIADLCVDDELITTIEEYIPAKDFKEIIFIKEKTEIKNGKIYYKLLTA